MYLPYSSCDFGHSYFLAVYSVSVFLVHLGGNTMDIKREADVNNTTECMHDDTLTAGMFAIYYATLSTLISLCIACLMFALFYY